MVLGAVPLQPMVRGTLLLQCALLPLLLGALRSLPPQPPPLL